MTSATSKKLIYGLILLVLIQATLLPLGVHTVQAYKAGVAGSVEVKIEKIEDVNSLITQVLGVLQFILFAIAGIFIVIAGYSYLTAQGDADKTANARNMIMYAIIAVGIGLLATFLSVLVQNLLKST